MTDYLDNGVSEYDVYDRISNMSLFAAKLWGKGDLDLTGAQARSEELGDAPRTNFGYEVDSATDEYMNLPMDELKDTSANNFAVNEGENASIVEVDGKNALELNGGTSYITTGLETAGLGNDLRVKVKRTSDSTDEQILFESPYGSIKAVQAETGKVGFSRERYDYSFNYTLPLNEWVELEFKNQQNSIQLYVNGELVDTIGDGERVEGRPLLATMMFPMSVIGSETNSFIGYVDDVRIGVNADFASTMSLDYAIWSAVSILDESNTDTLTPLIEEGKAVLTQYNPDAAEIARLTEELNNAVAASDYETADYSRIEAYKSLVTDLSAFTDESAANVTRVLESIRYGLPASMQDVVDGYEKALVDAIDALETKPLTNLYYVDQSTMTATASSYQQDGSNPSNVLDGNPSTMWHTNWNITTMPHWIDLQMSEPTEIAGLVYTPRQTGTNGNVTSYEIQVLVDGQYVTHATGTLPNNSETKEITFDPITTTNVRLVYNQAVNNNGSAAELQVVRANISADIEGLQAAVENAKTLMNQLDKNAYTDESWSALESVIAAAEGLLGQEDPDANDVANMIYDIQKAVTELRLKDKAEEPDPVVDKTELYALLEQYGGYKSSDYTAETWKPFKAAYDAAKEVYLDESATQEEVDAAIEELARTGKALVKASEPTVPSDGDEQTTEKPPVTTPGTTVKTGVTETAGVIYAMALILSVGAISVLVWRRRVSK